MVSHKSAIGQTDGSSACRNASIRLDSEVADNFPVFIIILADQVVERVRAQDQGFEAAGNVEPAFVFRPCKNLVQLGAQKSRNGLRRAGRGEQPEPDVDPVSKIKFAN